jgi:hypothetical protein
MTTASGCSACHVRTAQAVASVPAWNFVTRIPALIELKQTVCGSPLTMDAIGMVPPIGARVASFALLSSASPDRPCLVLMFNEGIKETPPSAIVDEHHSTQSKPLLVAFPFDGTFYVKKSLNAPTFVVDAKVLAGRWLVPLGMPRIRARRLPSEHPRCLFQIRSKGIQAGLASQSLARRVARAAVPHRSRTLATFAAERYARGSISGSPRLRSNCRSHRRT